MLNLGIEVKEYQVLKDMIERDKIDKTRENAPLIRPKDAFFIAFTEDSLVTSIALGSKYTLASIVVRIKAPLPVVNIFNMRITTKNSDKHIANIAKYLNLRSAASRLDKSVILFSIFFNDEYSRYIKYECHDE